MTIGEWSVPPPPGGGAGSADPVWPADADVDGGAPPAAVTEPGRPPLPTGPVEPADLPPPAAAVPLPAGPLVKSPDAAAGCGPIPPPVPPPAAPTICEWVSRLPQPPNSAAAAAAANHRRADDPNRRR